LSAVITNSSAVCRNAETNRNSFHDGSKEFNKNGSQNEIKNKHGFVSKDN